MVPLSSATSSFIFTSSASGNLAFMPTTASVSISNAGKFLLLITFSRFCGKDTQLMAHHGWWIDYLRSKSLRPVPEDFPKVFCFWSFLRTCLTNCFLADQGRICIKYVPEMCRFVPECTWFVLNLYPKCTHFVPPFSTQLIDNQLINKILIKISKTHGNLKTCLYICSQINSSSSSVKSGEALWSLWYFGEVMWRNVRFCEGLKQCNILIFSTLHQI